MRNLLALSALALVTFALVGWYLGWYRVQTEPAGDGHRQVTIDINGPKIGQDVNKGKEKLRGILDNKNAAQAPTAPAAPGTQPGGPNMPPPPQTVWRGPQPTTQAPPSWSRPGEDGAWAYPGQPDVPPPPSVPQPPLPTLPTQGGY